MIRKYSILVVLTLGMLLTSLPGFGQNYPPPPTANPGGDGNDPNAPIDGGLISLLAAGAGIGYRKYKVKNSDNEIIE